jgi:hypothetical protein
MICGAGVSVGAVQIQFTATPDPALTTAAVRHGLRRPVLLARAAGWAGLLATAFLLVTTGSLNTPLLVLGVLLAVGVPLVLLNVAARRAIRSRHVTTYEISDAGVVSSRFAYTWNAIRSVRELPGQLAFELADVRYLPVPTAGLTTAQIDQILDLASTHGLEVHRRAALTQPLTQSARSGS